MFLAYVPLMPFGWAEFDRPERESMFPTISRWDFLPAEDLASALLLSLDTADFTPTRSIPHAAEQESSLLLQGTVHKTYYYGTLITYGLSFYGGLPWFLGAPASTSENVLAFSLSLLDEGGDELWSYEFEGSESVLMGVYYNWLTDVRGYPVLFQRGLDEAMPLLERRLEELASE